MSKKSTKASKATKKTVKKAAKKATKKTVKKAAKKTTKKTVKKAAKKTTKKTVKKAAKKTTKKVETSEVAPVKILALNKEFKTRKLYGIRKFRNADVERNGENRFLHITKTAGTSVRNAEGVNPWWHRRFTTFKPNEIPADDFLFTCIRNPYDRAISWYHYVHGQLGNSLNTLKNEGKIKGNNQYLVTMSILARGATLNEYWTKFMSEESFAIHNKGFVYAASQIEYLRGRGSSPAPIAKRFDYIMKFEQLQSDWDILRESRGVGELGWMKKSRKREKKHWSEVLSPEAIDNISKFYAEDFEFLPYTKYAD